MMYLQSNEAVMAQSLKVSLVLCLFLVWIPIFHVS